MKVILYTISVLMVIAWALGFFVYALEENVHLLLLSALLLGALGIFKKS